jgi:hypothetical protein
MIISGNPRLNAVQFQLLKSLVDQRFDSQQVDLALSQFPKGPAAELASDQAPRFADRINRAPRIGRSCEVGMNLDSTAEEIAKIGRSAADSRGARKQRSRR